MLGIFTSMYTYVKKKKVCFLSCLFYLHRFYFVLYVSIYNQFLFERQCNRYLQRKQSPACSKSMLSQIQEYSSCMLCFFSLLFPLFSQPFSVHFLVLDPVRSLEFLPSGKEVYLFLYLTQSFKVITAKLGSTPTMRNRFP